MSGAPDLDWSEVASLVYSSPPCPAFDQQICRSLWLLLKLSTDCALSSNQAQYVTTGTSLTLILLAQFSLLAPVPPPPPPAEHPTRAATTAAVMPAASRALRFTI